MVRAAGERGHHRCFISHDLYDVDIQYVFGVHAAAGGTGATGNETVSNELHLGDPSSNDAISYGHTLVLAADEIRNCWKTLKRFLDQGYSIV